MEYLEPSAARDLPGLRLALTSHVPAPYSMSAKAIFNLRDVEYTPVAQAGAGENADLVAWTGHRNAPVAVYNDEAPRTGWLEILNLAQRLGTGASLLPNDIQQRMRMIGLTNELIGENGLIWNIRLIMLSLAGPEREASVAQSNPMYGAYGYSEQARSAAQDKVTEILECFTAHAREQREQGSQYLIGNKCSALDVYWAYFSLIFKTLPEQDCPMPSGLRKSYEMGSDVVGGCDPLLIDQRDWIYANHLPLPMEF